jgi:branched-chain amino acid transport system permease protein
MATLAQPPLLLARIVRSRTVWICLIVVALAATLPLYVSGYILGLLTIAYYFGVFAMAWDLLFGFAGEVNFGPTFLIGLRAYTAGIPDNLYQPPIWACLLAGTFAAVAGGVVLALPALRVRGPYFGLTTLVAVLMLQNFVVVAAGFSGGEIGLTVPDVISIDDGVNYWIALGFMTVSGAILYALSLSPVGLILQASGQDAVQAGALGFNVTKHKLAAFIISALFSGLAGSLMVFYLGAASVGTFIDVTVGVQVIIAAVIGGRRTILGGVLGAVFLIGMGEVLRPLGDLATVIVSAMALVVVLRRRHSHRSLAQEGLHAGFTLRNQSGDILRTAIDLAFVAQRRLHLRGHFNAGDMVWLVRFGAERLWDADRCPDVELRQELRPKCIGKDHVIQHFEVIQLLEQRDVALHLVPAVEDLGRPIGH